MNAGKRLRSYSCGVVLGALALGSEAIAQAGDAPAAAPEQPSLLGALMQMLPMLAVCYLIFYFMVIRPQESKVKQQRALLESLKRGDSVVTTSGIIGKVASVEKDHLMVEIAQNVKVKMLLSHITGLEGAGQKAKAS